MCPCAHIHFIFLCEHAQLDFLCLLLLLLLRLRLRASLTSCLFLLSCVWVCAYAIFISLSLAFSSSSLPNPGGGRSENGTSRVVAHKNIRNRQLPHLDEQTEEKEGNREVLPLAWRSAVKLIDVDLQHPWAWLVVRLTGDVISQTDC